MGVASIDIMTASIRTGIFDREFSEGNHGTSQSMWDMCYIGFLSLFDTGTLITLIHSKSTCCLVSYNLTAHVHNHRFRLFEIQSTIHRVRLYLTYMM